MFVFTAIVSIACLVLAIAGGVYGYAVMNSPSGGDMGDAIGFMVGMAVWAVSAVLGIVGVIGGVICVNRMYGT